MPFRSPQPESNLTLTRNPVGSDRTEYRRPTEGYFMRTRCIMPHDAGRDTYLVLGLRGSTRLLGKHIGHLRAQSGHYFRARWHNSSLQQQVNSPLAPYRPNSRCRSKNGRTESSMAADLRFPCDLQMSAQHHVAIQACGPTAHIWKGVVFPSRRLVDIRACLRYSSHEGLNSVWS